MTPFSRKNPSPEYSDLISMYNQMHAEGHLRESELESDFMDKEHAFHGQSLNRWLRHIRSLIQATQCLDVLDYGSGKGTQYTLDVKDGNTVIAPNIRDYWKLEDITCFDPGVPEICNVPDSKFDGVIATDVLEHVPESDVFWVVEELFSFARKFVFASIPCYKAAAILPDGRNAHITLRSPFWWLGVFQSAQAKYPQIQFSTAYLIPIKGQDDRKSVEFLHSFKSDDVDFTLLNEPELTHP